MEENCRHSHRDLETIREIRNELERRGNDPVLFFLKCLEADDARLPELSQWYRQERLG